MLGVNDAAEIVPTVNPVRTGVEYSTKRVPAALCSSTSTSNGEVQTEAGLLKLPTVTTSTLSNVEIVPSLIDTVLAVIWQVDTVTVVSVPPLLTVF